MKTTIHVLACLFLMPGLLLAGEPTIVVMPDGTAWYSAGDGSPTIVIQNVVLPPGNTPAPRDPDDPRPPAPSGIRSKVKSWADDVDDVVGASLLRETFQLLADQIGKGAIASDSDSVNDALKGSVKRALDLLPRSSKPDDWEDVYDKILDELGPIVVRSPGARLSPVQWSKVLSDIAAGFDDATKNKAMDEEESIILQSLIQMLIKILLEWLSSRFGGA